MYVGGDVLEISFKHETLGSGKLRCKAAEDGTLEKGGLRNNDDENSVTGDGQLILNKNYRRGTWESPPVAWDMTEQKTLDVLSQMAESSLAADWTISHVSGQIWGGNGVPVGDIPGATNTAQITLKLAFNGKVKSLV